MAYWYEIHRGAPSRSLLGSIALHNKDQTLERIITRFTKETKDVMENRTYENFMEKLEKTFATTKEHVSFAKEEINNLKKG